MVAVEPILAVLVGLELAAQVVGRLVLRVLEVVLAVGAGLPDVEDGVGDGLAGQQVGDGAVHEGDAARGVGILDDGGAVVAEGGVGGPEGAEDGGRGRVDVALCHDFVGDFINEAVMVLVWGVVVQEVYKDLRLQTKHIRHSVRLVARLGRNLAHSVDKVHARHPLVHRQLDLTRKVVQVPQQGRHDLAVARRHVGAHGVDDALRESRVEAAALAVGAIGGAVGGHFGSDERKM